MKKALFFAIAVAMGSPALAQTLLPPPTNEEVRAPRPARGPGIPSAVAIEAAQAAIAACGAQGHKVTALVVDSQATPIAMVSADGAAAITQRIAAGKAATTIKMKMSSGEAAAKAKTDPAFLASLMADPSMGSPRQGALPIKIGNDVLGAIAVSGAPGGDIDETCAVVALPIIATRVAARAAPAASAKLDPKQVMLTLPKDLKWTDTNGASSAPLFGDPSKPGFYGVLIKWPPGRHSKPHSHNHDRFAYVISGTWWKSTSSTLDMSTLVPIPAGSMVEDVANQIHWDGALDDTALIMLVGEGPLTTKQVDAK
ncbi:MAG TPA: heme-binding protein [Caulobacterales bacterium]|nr:heme-binding protein [Caulobacterales bacterium]